MEQWKLVSIKVAVFAFTLEIRPLDSFITAYLTSPIVNVTLNEVSNELTPIRMYSAVLGTFLVFMLTDYVRYKAVMVFNGLIGMLTYICLINSSTIFHLKLTEFGLSLFTCTEMSYYGYLYAKIKDKKHYQVATGYVKAGTLSGICLSGLLGQLIVYVNDHDYSSLPYFSLPGVTFATVWACFLPSIENSKYDQVEDGTKTDVFSKSVIHDPSISKYSTEQLDSQNDESTSAVIRPFKRLYGDFKHSYTNDSILQWCFWHIIGLAGYIQVYLYMNILYTYVTDESGDKNVLLNGVVESLATICGAFCAYNIGKIDVDWTQYGDKFMMVNSLAIGMILCICCFLKNIIFVYIMYILYTTLVQSTFVIVISQIAKHLKDKCFTLVLGFNAFLAIILGTCLSTLLVYIDVTVPGMFLVYSGTYTVLGLVYGYSAFCKNSSK